MKKEMYILYYTWAVKPHGKLFYARKRPGDGGKDWEVTEDPKLAGHFSFAQLQKWVKLHGKSAGWRVALDNPSE